VKGFPDCANVAPLRGENPSPSPDTRIIVLRQVTGDGRSLAEDGMDKVVTDRIERQVRSAFPDGAIARVQVLQYGDDPEVEPGQAAMRVFFDWPGRSEGKKADPKTVHAFCNVNEAALGVLHAGP
jgi:hypothetical protein